MPPNWPAVATRATSADLAVFRCGRSFTPSPAARPAMKRVLASSLDRSRTRAGVGTSRRSIAPVCRGSATQAILPPMDWETIQEYVRQYGYFAVGIGTFADQSGMQAFVVAGGVNSQVAAGVSLYGVILA